MQTTTVEEAVARIPDGASLMVGGFMAVGTPERLMDELVRQGKRDLTVIANDTAMPGAGIGKLITAKSVRRVIASHIGLNPQTQAQMIAGEIEVELVPQGTLAERMRAGGAGIPAFYTPAGFGTQVAEGKEVREFDGRMYVMERGITGEFAIVKAWKADRYGNLCYRLTARNFNPLAAMAGKITIAEVEELVEVGQLDPDEIHTPGVFVQRVVVGGGAHQKRIERRTVRKS